MVKFIAAAIAAFTLVVVPAAAGSTQSSLVPSDSFLTPKDARGAQATVGVPNVSGLEVGGPEVYSFVRLESSFGLVQIGWDKSIGPAGGDGPCTDPGQTILGLVVEWASGGNPNCAYIPTPTGYTWGQAVTMAVKYDGNGRGDPALADYTYYFDGTAIYVLNDLGWAPSTGTWAKAGAEITGSNGDVFLYETTVANLGYQDIAGSESDSFIVADNADWQEEDIDFFRHTFTASPGTNSGSITFPFNGIDPNLTIIDNFNRANEDPLSDGGKWTNSVCGGSGCNETGLTVLSNQAKSKVTTTASAFRNDVTLPSSTETYATIAVKPGNGNGVRLYCRIQEAGTSGADGYFLYPQQNAGADEVRIYKMTNHSVSQIATTFYEFAAGDIFLFHCYGSVLEGWVRHDGNWSRLVTVTDTLYSTGGRTGFAIRGGTGRVDDFGAK